MSVALNKNIYIKWAITILGTLSLLLIPCSAEGFYTPTVRIFCMTTVFFLFCMGFEILENLMIGILLPVCYYWFGCAPMQTIMSGWLQVTLYMSVCGFLLGIVLSEVGVLNRLAYILMAKVGSGYFSLLFAIFIVGVILTALTMGGAYYITAALCLGLIIALDIRDTKMAASICMACILGSVSAKSFTYCVTYYSIIMGMAPQVFSDGLTISMLDSYIANWPMMVVCIFILWIISKWYKSDRELGSKEYFQKQLDKLGNWTRDEKIALIILAGIMVYMVTTNFTGFDSSLAMLIGPWLFFVPGIKCANPRVCFKNIPFDMIFFIAACMCIGTVASSLGFGQLIATYCVPIFTNSGNNIFVIMAVLFAIVFILNFLMTPMAIWALVTAPLVSIGLSLGINAEVFIYALMHSAELIIFPYEYVPYLTVYAYGMITMKDFVKMNILRCFIYLIGIFIILIPYWSVIGLV